MRCPHCYKNVEMKDGKDRETGMAYNYWACEEHGEVQPTKHTKDVFGLSVYQHRLNKRQAKELRSQK